VAYPDVDGFFFDGRINDIIVHKLSHPLSFSNDDDDDHDVDDLSMWRIGTILWKHKIEPKSHIIPLAY